MALQKFRRGQLTSDEAALLAAEATLLPVQLLDAVPHLPAAYTLARLYHPSVYDCLYAAVALALGCQVVTADRPFYLALEAALPGTMLWIEDVPEARASWRTSGARRRGIVGAEPSTGDTRMDTPGILTRFTSLIVAGDLDGARALCAPDARVWHSSDRLWLNVDEMLANAVNVLASVAGFSYGETRETPTRDGAVFQGTIQGKVGRATLDIPVVIVAQLRDGLIVQGEEYLGYPPPQPRGA